ncbi:MAG: hypothetical protein GYA23_12835 [Methanomicrobiales archaeon]|nr:hypothetical protein [Methanomicrobiales archaeon]
MKKTWTKPELVVLVRNTTDENLLTKCKDATVIISLGTTARSTITSRSRKSSCMMRLFGSGDRMVCLSCITPNAS